MNDESKCHTPFCRRDCKIVHHDLIKALCIERNRKETLSRFSSSAHVLLRQCIQSYEKNGWDRNSTVPDDLPDLKQPLLYLTCAFGKHRVLETLLKLNFDPSVTTKDGENGLHALVNHFYRVGNMKQCGGFMAIDKRLEVFENVVSTLCSRDPRVFSVKEKRCGRTPLHITAESVVYCTSRHARIDGRCDPLKRTRYFQRCLEVMLGHLLELKHKSLISLSQLTNTIAAQDNDGNTIVHILARSSCYPAWESIRNVLKNFSDSELPMVKNNESLTAFEILSSINADVARNLFYPSDHPNDKRAENVKDLCTSSSPLNCVLQHDSEASFSAVVTTTPYPEVTVKAVWSQAGEVQGRLLKGAQLGSSPKSLESVVLSLHTSAKGVASQHPYTGTSTSLNQYNEISTDVVVCDSQPQDSTIQEAPSDCRSENSPSVSSNGIVGHSRRNSFAAQVSSHDEPYPVFLPNLLVSETECANSSPHEIMKQEEDLAYSPCCVSPLSQNSLEVENHVGVSPSTSDSRAQDHVSEESVVTSVMSNGLSHIESTGRSKAETHVTIYPSVSHRVAENLNVSPAGDSAFFEFLLTQGSEFNPSIKFQIVELIKGEFGKKMANCNSEICQTETEKRRLEAEIHNSKVKLQQKEEEKLRLFAEIDNLQRNIVEATEKHRMVVQQCEKLREESIAVKRKISSCEEVERELCGTSAKSSKLAER